MKRVTFRSISLIPFGMVVLSVFLWSPDADSCGDKFLVVGRGVRYERAYASKFPSSILLFAVDTESRTELESLLKKAGHRIEAIGNQPQLEKALNSDTFDVALVNLTDLLMIEKQVKSSPSQPFILPFIYQSGGEIVPPKEYSCIVNSENKSTDVLRTIDAIMKSRLKGKPLNCEKILK